MRKIRYFLDYAIFTSSILLIFLLVFEPFIALPNIVRWIGHWHPVILHFPIVMIIIVIIQFWRKDQYFTYYLGFTAFLTFLTSITGFLLSLESSEKGNLISTHQWMGVSVAFILGIWYWLFMSLEKEKNLMIGMNAGLVILIILTGHFGGMITHGEQFLSFSSKSETEVVLLPEDPNIYQHFIQPILDRKCVSCHNQYKSKGKLKLTNYQDLITGGESGSLQNVNEIGQSLLLKKIHSPLESEGHMPPREEPQLTPEEIILLSEWIQNGAESNLLFSQLDKSMESNRIIQKTIDNQQSNQRNELPKVSNSKISEINSNYITVSRLFHHSNALQAIMYPHSTFKPGDVKKLEQISGNIVELNLNGLLLSNEDLAVIGKMSNLERLDLGRTTIDDGGLVKLKSLQKLKELKIYDSNLKDNDLNDIVGLASLQKIFAYNSELTDDAIARFIEYNPEVTITTLAEVTNEFVSVLPSPNIKDRPYFFQQPFKLFLEHPLKGIDIFYTLDGSVPNENSIKYSSGIDISEDTRIMYLASKEGWQSSPADSIWILRSGLTPEDFILKDPPNPKYPCTGPTLLFDLVKGPLTFDDTSWMAFRNKALVLECKWKSPQEISKVILSTLVNTNSYIFPPEYIRISGGSNLSESHLLFQLNPKKLKEDKGASFEYYECDIHSNSISYLRIEVMPLYELPVWHQGKGERGWFFIDEVLIN